MKTTESIRPYLCGPIEGCDDSECHDWRQDIIGAAFPRAINPMRRDYRATVGDHARVEKYAGEIVVLDKRDIDACDVLLVRWMPDKPSVGSAMEILYAFEQGKPVVLWYTGNEGDFYSPWLAYHATTVVYTRDDAIEAVKRCGVV